MDACLVRRREPAWHVFFLSQVSALPPPLPDHQHVTSGRSTAGLSPQAEPLAHNLSLSLLSRTTELLRARQRLCPVGRQGGSKRSKSLASWRVCYWDSSINCQERSILCTLPTAFPNILQTATTAIAPPAARKSHRSNTETAAIQHAQDQVLEEGQSQNMPLLLDMLTSPLSPSN